MAKVTVKTTIKNVWNVNKCGPDDDIAAMIESVWFWERLIVPFEVSDEDELVLFEALASREKICDEEYLLACEPTRRARDTVGGVVDEPDEFDGCLFHRGSLTFIPKKP